jgi:hypothetical protein
MIELDDIWARTVLWSRTGRAIDLACFDELPNQVVGIALLCYWLKQEIACKSEHGHTRSPALGSAAVTNGNGEDSAMKNTVAAR